MGTHFPFYDQGTNPCDEPLVLLVGRHRHAHSSSNEFFTHATQSYGAAIRLFIVDYWRSDCLHQFLRFGGTAIEIPSVPIESSHKGFLMDFSIDKPQPLTLVTLNLLERYHYCFHGLGHPLPPHEGKGIPVELTD